MKRKGTRKEKRKSMEVRSESKRNGKKLMGMVMTMLIISSVMAWIIPTIAEDASPPEVVIKGVNTSEGTPVHVINNSTREENLTAGVEKVNETNETSEINWTTNETGTYTIVAFLTSNASRVPRTSYSPTEATLSDTEGTARTFSITANQTVNVSWLINGTEVQTNASVTEASYTNTSAVTGTWNVSVIVSNANGTDVHTWIWNVERTSVTSFTIMPDEGITNMVSSYQVVVNTTGFNSLNISIPAGFGMVAPTSGDLIARMDLWWVNTLNPYYGCIFFTANVTDPENKVDVYADIGGAVATHTQNVNYTMGATTPIYSPFNRDNRWLELKLPTIASSGYLNISSFSNTLTNVTISIGPFVKNPAVVGDYQFVAKANDESTGTIKTVYMWKVTPSTIAVTPSNPMLCVGAVQHFKAAVYDQFGNKMPDAIVTWSSSNTTVGTINASGYFTASAPGTTIINATNGTAVGSAFVKVGIASGATISIPDATIFPGKSISLPIMIHNISGVHDANIKLHYDPNVVQVSGVTKGNFDELSKDLTNASRGFISINVWQTVSEAMSGDIKLVDVTLNAVGNANDSSSLDLEILQLRDDEANDIFASVVNGLLTIAPMPTPIVSINDTGAQQGRTVTVPIMIYDAVDVAGIHINLTYDPAVVRVTGAAGGDFGDLVVNLAHSAEGWVRLLAMTFGSGLSGNATVAYITLRAVGSIGDTSTLNIGLRELFDSSGNPILAQTSNGTFTVLTPPPPSVVSYTISNTTISPNGDGYQDSTAIDLAFSEIVNCTIAIENSTGVVKVIYRSPSIQNPTAKIWDGRDEFGNIVSDGVYRVNVTMVSVMSGLSAFDNNRTITVTSEVAPPPAGWEFDLHISLDDVDKSNLTFGLNESATDLYDSGIDDTAPPAEPSGFTVYFMEPEPSPKDELWRDIKALNYPKNWTLVAVAPAMKTVNISWSTSAIPVEVNLTIQEIDLNTGEPIGDVIKMKTPGSIEFTGGAFASLTKAFKIMAVRQQLLITDIEGNPLTRAIKNETLKVLISFNGTPVEGADVMFALPPTAVPVHGTSNESGIAEYLPLITGTLRITARATIEGVEYRATPVEIEVVEAIHDINITTDYAGAVNGIRIEDATGRTISADENLTIGEMYYIKYKIVNDGNFNESVNIMVRVFNATWNQTIVHHTWVIDAGTYKYGNDTWDTSGLASGVYIITVNASIPIDDDLTNNVRGRIVAVETAVPPVLTSIEVLPSSAAVNIGNTQQFTATAKDQHGNPMAGINITWTSSNITVGDVNPEYAVTDSNGNAFTTFTANAIGTTTITATNGTVSGTANVTVIKLEVFIDSYELCLNREIVIPIKIKDATNIAGGSLAITYNASVINAVSVSGGHFGEPAYNIDNTNGRVSLACARTYAVNRTEAVLANIVFKGVGEGFTPLSIQNAILNDEEGNVIYPGTSDGSITVRSYMLGDVNYNNMLDTGDATLVLRMIVGLKEQDMLGDMNDNGMIDTGDATLILRRVVGL